MAASDSQRSSAAAASWRSAVGAPVCRLDHCPEGLALSRRTKARAPAASSMHTTSITHFCLQLCLRMLYTLNHSSARSYKDMKQSSMFVCQKTDRKFLHMDVISYDTLIHRRAGRRGDAGVAAGGVGGTLRHALAPGGAAGRLLGGAAGCGAACHARHRGRAPAADHSDPQGAGRCNTFGA
jgi:hypothetical protein